MPKKQTLISGLVLAAATAAGLSTAIAQQGPGPDAPEGFEGRVPAPERIFAKIDADKDGKITRAEIDAWKAARPKVEDSDGDGKISPAELAAPRIAEATELFNDQAAETVKRLDTDGDGLLSAAELAAGPGFGPGPQGPRGPGFEAIFDRIDADKDGAVTLQEAQAAQQHFADRREGDRPDRGWRGRDEHDRGGHGKDRRGFDGKGPRGKGPVEQRAPGDLPPPPPGEGAPDAGN